MKTRRHHNNKGARQIKRGKTVEQVKRIARRLGVPFVSSPALPSRSGDGQANRTKPQLCSECGIYSADKPSRLCVGCDAYREHTNPY